MSSEYVSLKESEVNGIRVLTLDRFTRLRGDVWRCRCHCGRRFTATGASLASRRVRSCGCELGAASKRKDVAPFEDMQVVVTKDELVGMLKSYGIGGVWGPLKSLVRSRGFVFDAPQVVSRFVDGDLVHFATGGNDG